MAARLHVLCDYNTVMQLVAMYIPTIASVWHLLPIMSDKEVLIAGEIAETGAPWDAGTYQQVNTDDKQKEFEDSETEASSEPRG